MHRTVNARQTLIVGRDRFRIGPWHADHAIAYLSLPPESPRPTDAGLGACIERIARGGYRSIITSALHPDEAGPFLRHGFEEFDRLRVLAHPLRERAADANWSRPPAGVRLRRARRSDRDAALEVDHRAFPEFWRLDRDAMDDAETATPARRFRVADAEGVVAYAITGRSGAQAFLQRLATDPSHSGRGIAGALIGDALRWATRHRCRRLLVNTQQDNHRALALYERLGFQLTPSDLVVLSRQVT
jgi:GNAT superfamily N-acetyltransferase